MFPVGVMVVNLSQKHAYIKRAHGVNSKTCYGRNIYVGDTVVLY